MARDNDENGANEKYMYSDKINVNILTSLMVAHGVRTVVVCPGSRNAPLAHNFASCPEMHCVAATDERSAGFYALGLALASERPVAVCVTSGSALLNLAPAVAEAYYREVPLLVISADRPLAMINQLQGQTLPQAGALGMMVKATMQLPEPHNEVERWHCNRLVNEAMIKMLLHGGGPVHINVPISEPLYNFAAEELPEERKISMAAASADKAKLTAIADDFAKARKPLIVVGQMERREWHRAAEAVEMLETRAVVLAEKLSDDSERQLPALDMLVERMAHAAEYQPDYIIYVGGNMVAKAMRQFLQQTKPRRSIVVSEAGDVADVMMNATDIVEAKPSEMLRALASAVASDSSAASVASVASDNEASAWMERWQRLKAEAIELANVATENRQNEAIREFFRAIRGKEMNVHVANSLSVRMALKYADRYLYVNRGVNGIEGSLSTAAGFSIMSACPVACIIGDLSFFYDANALWNQELCGNFRILLINNKCGGIFSKFERLADSPACDSYVMAKHNATAEGVCMQNNVAYRKAETDDEVRDGISWLVDEKCPRPMVLEVMG